MDAKNQQDRAKMVEEAVGRMCRLGMMPQVITKFRKQGTVLKSETAGILYDLNDEEKNRNCTCKRWIGKNRVGGGVMLEYNEQTENLMEIAMMLEQLKGESEYLFEVLTDIDSITWKQKFVDWANEFTETYEPNKDVWPGNYLEVIEGFAREKILEFAGVEDKE